MGYYFSKNGIGANTYEDPVSMYFTAKASITGNTLKVKFDFSGCAELPYYWTLYRISNDESETEIYSGINYETGSNPADKKYIDDNLDGDDNPYTFTDTRTLYYESDNRCEYKVILQPQNTGTPGAYNEVNIDYGSILYEADEPGGGGTEEPDPEDSDYVNIYFYVDDILVDSYVCKKGTTFKALFDGNSLPSLNDKYETSSGEKICIVGFSCLDLGNGSSYDLASDTNTLDIKDNFSNNIRFDAAYYPVYTINYSLPYGYTREPDDVSIGFSNGDSITLPEYNGYDVGLQIYKYYDYDNEEVDYGYCWFTIASWIDESTGTKYTPGSQLSIEFINKDLNLIAELDQRQKLSDLDIVKNPPSGYRYDGLYNDTALSESINVIYLDELNFNYAGYITLAVNYIKSTNVSIMLNGKFVNGDVYMYQNGSFVPCTIEM